jgi:alpha-tubulin suppressor-like RCC1 family protein
VGGALSGGASSSASAGTSASGSAGAASAGSTPLFVSLGFQHGCAVTSAGGVKCWGQIGAGQLGDGKTSQPDQAVPAPVDVVGLSAGMVAIAAGGYHSCALSKAGGVKCWGRNSYGQLGNDSTENSAVPVDVVGLASGAVEIQAGINHTCAKLADGTLQCWGSNRWGELGDGTGSMSADSDAKTPRTLSALGPVGSFSLGEGSTCAVTSAGSAQCWGDNSSGQLGTGTQEDALTPAQVVGLEAGVAQISMSGSFACAVTMGGTAKCWGENTSSQLGDDTTQRALTPVDVLGLTNVKVIQAGYVHTCALTADATVKCWGSDENGQVGTDHTGNERTPFQVPSLSGVVQLSTHSSTNCVVLSSPATIKCWGTNSYGELGNDGGSKSRTPKTLPGF